MMSHEAIDVNEFLPSAAQANTTSSRKRRGTACLSCRARKVRCDVSSRGQPCTNCLLDSKNCLVVGRESRLGSRRAIRRQLSQAAGKLWGDSSLDSNIPTTAAPRRTPETDPVQLSASGTASEFGIDTFNAEEKTRRRPATPSCQSSDESSTGCDNTQPTDRVDAEDVWWKGSPTPATTAYGRRHDTDVRPKFSASCQITAELHVSYTHYSFLTASKLHAIPPQDVNFLESQGCLHVPVRPLLDDFVQAYFLHVHVTLPILNEGDFWDMYFQNDKPGGSREQISLLVFRAILYASCNYVSFDTVKKLGFSNFRTARAALYRQVKLLYDMGTETSSLCLAQAALLLTCWMPSTNATLSPNSSWLGLAIQHARSLNADRCDTLDMKSTAISSHEQKFQNTIRRLWWSCIIRDRLGSLCSRRGIQIVHDRADLRARSPLGFTDLEDEMCRSSVYSVATKRTLIRLLAHYIQFCIALTDTLLLVFPSENPHISGRKSEIEEDERIDECKHVLQQWYKRASSCFPEDRDAAGDLAEDKRHHKSVVLHTNVLW